MTSLLLGCGCKVPFRDGEPPACPTHGPQRVVRVLGMRKPTFRGAVSGPCAKTTDVAPWSGPLVGGE